MILFLSFIMWVDISEGTFEGFVLQGNRTQIKNYPHSVYLNIACTKVTYICGGSIINQRVILTAGHCLEDCVGTSREDVHVRYGHEDVSKMKRSQMRDFIIHEGYDEESMDNDIGLLITKQPIQLGNLVQKVVLMTSTPKYKLAHMAGWGAVNSRNEASVALFDAVQEMQPPKVCKLVGHLPRGTFCAGPVRGPGVPDRGDSGSALMMMKYVQIGLVSYKVDHYTLVVYTNVSYHYNWIRFNSRRLFCRNR